MTILKTYKVRVSEIYLSDDQRRNAQKMINQYWYGEEDCNVWDEDKNTYVAKYPDIEDSNPTIKEAHHKINCSFGAIIEVDLLADGRLIPKQAV